MKLWTRSTPRKRMLPLAGALLTSSTLALLATVGVGAGAATAATSGGPVALLATVGNGPSGKIVIAGAIGDWGTALAIDKNGKPNENGNYVKVTLRKGTFEIDSTALNKKTANPHPQACQQHQLLGQRQRQRPRHALQRHRALQRHYRNRERDPRLHRSRPALPKRTEEGAVQPHRQRGCNARLRDRPRNSAVQLGRCALSPAGQARQTHRRRPVPGPTVPSGAHSTPPPARGQGSRTRALPASADGERAIRRWRSFRPSSLRCLAGGVWASGERISVLAPKDISVVVTLDAGQHGRRVRQRANKRTVKPGARAVRREATARHQLLRHLPYAHRLTPAPRARAGRPLRGGRRPASRTRHGQVARPAVPRAAAAVRPRGAML